LLTVVVAAPPDYGPGDGGGGKDSLAKSIDKAISRPRGAPPLRTLPEQIAAKLGLAIAEGTIQPGERLLELEIAAAYGVSRAPVREAIRLLAKRGLAEFFPRRGAYVMELTIDRLIDLFNTRTVLQCLAARYFATVAPDEAIERLYVGLEALEQLAVDPNCDPVEYAFASWRVVAIVGRNCGSDSLAELLAHQVDSTVLGTIWRQGSIGYDTEQKRLEVARATRALHDALAVRDCALADARMRVIMETARDHAVTALSRLRSESVDDVRLRLAGY
jgi:DNA-binding GntR family transcriptional regulator